MREFKYGDGINDNFEIVDFFSEFEDELDVQIWFQWIAPTQDLVINMEKDGNKINCICVGGSPFTDCRLAFHLRRMYQQLVDDYWSREGV